MPVMHPILTNFSKGELSPKLAGRTDLSIANQGALEMTNVLALPTGGAIKRPGTQAVIDILDDITSDVNCIPWSVDATHDFIIVLTPGHLKIVNVSYGSPKTYVKGIDGSPIDITSLGTIGSAVFDMYTDVYNISYAQTLNKIFIAHKSGNYPLFYIEYRRDNGDNTFDLEYGLVTFVGNVAKTEKIEEEGAIKAVPVSQIIDLLKGYLPSGSSSKTWTSVDGLSGEVKVGTETKTITSIKLEREVKARRAETTFEGTYYDSSASAPVSDNWKYLGTGVKKYTEGILFWQSEWMRITGVIGEYATIAETKSERLDRLEKFHLLHGQTYAIGGPYIDDLYSWGTLKFFYGKVRYTLTIYYNGGSIVKTSQAYGEVSCWIEISSINIKINGYSSYVSDLIDKTTIWMIPDVAYPCDEGTKLEGKSPSWAVRKDTDDGPSLVVTFSDGTTKTYTRKDSKVTGQIKVNVTPFVSGGFPTAITFWQGRMVVASKNILYISKVNDITNFSFFEEIQYTHTEMAPSSEWQDPNIPEYVSITSTSQQIQANSGMFFIIATDENEYIQNLVAEDNLFIFTLSSEFAIPGGTTAINARVKMLSRVGSSYIQPRFIGSAPIFVNQSRTKLYFAGDVPVDATKYADHLFTNDKIVKIDYVSDPNSVIIVTTESGLVYYGTILEDGISFVRIKTTGTIVNAIGIRGYNKDDIYIICRRPSIGKTTLEIFSETNDASFEKRVYLDYDIYINQYTTQTIPSLANKEVSYIIKRGDEYITGTGTIDPSGGIPFLVNGDEAHIGIGYESRIKTFRIDSVSTDMYLKRAGKIFFVCDKTGPFYLVNDPYGLYHPKEIFPILMPEIDGIEEYPYSGIISYENPAAWDIAQYIILESHEPHPFCVLSIIAEFDISEV